MKTIKLKFVIAGFVLFFLGLANFSNCLAQCGNHSEHSTSASDTINKTDTASYYTCTMHPEIQSTFPTTCPKCGMELVKTSANKKSKNKMMGRMGMSVMMVAMMSFMILDGTIYMMNR